VTQNFFSAFERALAKANIHFSERIKDKGQYSNLQKSENKFAAGKETN
jgi:hypothetical protein